MLLAIVFEDCAVRNVYDLFNAKRKQLDVQIADAEDLKMLEDLEKSIIEKGKDGNE